MSGRRIRSTAPSFPSKFRRPGDSPGFLLWQVTNSWQRRVRQALKETGLTHVQFVLLTSIDWLSNANQPTTQRNIARFAHTDVMMTSQVVRTLEAKKLVVVEENPSDSRAHRVEVTPAGHRLVKRALKLVEDTDGAFFGPITGELDRFTHLLRSLAKQVEPAGPKASPSSRGPSPTTVRSWSPAGPRS